MAKKPRSSGTGSSNGSQKHKRELWAAAMLANGGNQTQAAVAAGHKAGDAAVRAGNRYANDERAKELLKKLRAAAVRKARLTADDSMVSLSRDVKFNPRRFLEATGMPKQILDRLDDATLEALRGVKLEPVVVTTGRGKNKRTDVVYRVEAKFPEKTAAREQAMKHFGLYERDNKQKPFYMPPELIVQGVAPKRGGRD